MVKLQRYWEGRTLMSFTSLKGILGANLLGANFLLASVNTKIRVNAVSVGFSLTWKRFTLYSWNDSSLPDSLS